MQAAVGAWRTRSLAAGTRRARLPEPSAAGGRAPASRAPCRGGSRLPTLHFRNGAAWSGPAGGITARSSSDQAAAVAAGPFPPAPHSAPACAELSPPGEPAEPPRLLPRLPLPSHVIIRLQGLRLLRWPLVSPSPAGPSETRTGIVTSWGRGRPAGSVPAGGNGGAVSWRRYRC